MNDWKLPWNGACMCGGVRFQISAPPLLTMACHCTGCQKLSASAYSLTAQYQPLIDAFAREGARPA